MRLLVAVAVVVAAWMWWTAPPATAIAPAPPPQGNVQPTLDPVPAGGVAVVASSAPVDGRIAVIVQNGTTNPVRRVRVTALATRPDGGLATKATARDLLPATLAPGAIALGLVEFRPRDAPAGSKVSFEVRSGRSPSDDDPTALSVGSLVLSPPMTGAVAQTLDAVVENPNRRTVESPLLVRVMCFGESAQPSFAVDRTLKKTKLRHGGTVATTVELRELCPSYLVAARGRSER